MCTCVLCNHHIRFESKSSYCEYICEWCLAHENKGLTRSQNWLYLRFQCIVIARNLFFFPWGVWLDSFWSKRGCKHLSSSSVFLCYPGDENNTIFSELAWEVWRLVFVFLWYELAGSSSTGNTVVAESSMMLSSVVCYT